LSIAARITLGFSKAWAYSSPRLASQPISSVTVATEAGERWTSPLLINAAGAWADVVVFDYDKIQDRATYEQPLLTPVGIDYVLVNGAVAVENGKHTGVRSGKVLYGPGRQQ